MRKQLGILTSLVFLCATALMWVGCSNSNCCYERTVCCEQPCAPCCEDPCLTCDPCDPCSRVCPAPCCEPLCRPAAKCRHPNRNELCCIDGITVYASNPKMCMLGDQYPLEFNVKACKDVCDVIVNTSLPEGVTYIRSEPEAQVDGNRLTWDFGMMEKDQCIHTKVWVKCECEGELCACFCATATPVRFCSLLCAKPVLSCRKCGPDECKPCEPINYTVTVTNRGSCTATGVVVTDNVPEGLEHCSGQRTLTWNLGCLEPCETKRVDMCFKAVKRGEICNTAVVTACNADSVSCTSKCIVCLECVEIEKVGPKEVQIGQNADYTITVTNVGDKPLTQVVVTDCAPSATSIVSAKGARINGNQAVWRLKQMNPGEKVTFNLTLYSCTPGCYTNRVSVNNCQGCCDCAEFTTRWKGRPALTMCINDTADPVCVGEPTSYCIEVTNQGSESDDNVVVVVRFPPEVVPESISGDVEGTISGQTVTFAPYDHFSPRQTLCYRVNARAKASGDARIVAEVSSATIQKPIMAQESTIVN
ncbi:MAG: DUF11 domain-containing protein [Chlamydiales bacterium]|nr:DUF11 domain-containing protein [Chlamydiia bacterium]MCP5508086.1 DUF11 domain-containing protein [Chlamydiales bacterium]